jgi:hypothetical protein
LAQKDMQKSKSSSEAICVIGETRLRTDAGLQLVEPEDLRSLIKDAIGIRELDNFAFWVRQKDPNRYVEIEIGPGDWTMYTIESDDITWTLGRHYELTEQMLIDRSSYAKHKIPAPRLSIQKGSLLVYEDLPWKAERNWRISFQETISNVAIGVNVVVAIFAILLAFSYFGKTARQRAEANVRISQFFDSRSFVALVLLALSYGLLYVAARKLHARQLKSRVIVRKPSLLLAFTFRDAKIDPIGLGSFYIGVAALVATVVASLR